MIDTINDIRLPLDEIFHADNSGDTLTIWDQYFIGSMNPNCVNFVANTIASIQAINHVVVYIGDSGLFLATYHNDGLEPLRYLKKALNKNHISFDVFSYHYHKDTKQRIHGRYWYSASSGFLMDGSLNGVGDNLCIAVSIDEFAFSRIKNLLEEKKAKCCKPINLMPNVNL
jgi:hypothetical protein